MARVLAVDYGMKRVGLAVTDPMQLIANGLTTVSNQEVIEFITNYCKVEQVEHLVIGEPKTLDNKPAGLEHAIQKFIEKLNKALPELEISRVDERFTSSMAMQSLVAGGVKKKQRQRKELLDEECATIILQSYLEQKTL